MPTIFEDVEFYLKDLELKFRKIDPKAYYLSYSGGRDSHLLYWFIKDYLGDTNIKIVGCNTLMEHPQILKRIYANSDVVLLPTLKLDEIKAKHGSPCFSKSQDDFIDRYQRGSRAKSTMERIYRTGEDGSWTKFKLSKKARTLLLDGSLHRVSPKCCKYLKKEPFQKYEKQTGLKPIMGVRAIESNMRRAQYTSCFTKDGKFTPIWDLSDDLMQQIIDKYNIEVPEVYNHVRRTGCCGCPYGTYKKDTQKELATLPNERLKFVGAYFKESYEVLGINVEDYMKDEESPMKDEEVANEIAREDANES